MAFYTILTEIGKAKLANATALGTTLQLTGIAVGDGGGVAVTPTETMTALVNQVWTGPINHLYVDTSNANWIVAESYIPTDVGDFTVREVGIFDIDGDLIAIGNYPDTYKPISTSGAAKDLYLKIVIEVSNSSTVELKIDPAVVLASRKYVDDSLASHNADETGHNLTAREEDIVFADSMKGIVFIDQNTGTKYRLFVDSGNLGIEEVV